MTMKYPVIDYKGNIKEVDLRFTRNYLEQIKDSYIQIDKEETYQYNHEKDTLVLKKFDFLLMMVK